MSGRIAEIPPAAHAATDHWYMPGFMKDAIHWVAEELTKLATWIWDTIKEVLKGAAAPAYFFAYAFSWQDVRGVANGVAGELTPSALKAGQSWTGTAAKAYAEVIPPQDDAINKIATISEKTASTLAVCAAAGLTFYLGIALILAKFIAALVTAIAAFGTVVFSWAGAALVVEEAGVNSGLIWTAITTLTAALGTQVEQLVGLHGEAVDNSTFPGGHWPDPATTSYRDATVTDGDADWSLAT